MSKLSDQLKRHCCPFEGCSSAFNRPYRLAQHLLVHNNVKAFTCPEQNCSKAYTNKSHLDRHVNSVHKTLTATEVVIYICPKCMKKYANRQNLKRHLKIYHKIDHKAKLPFVCDMCDLKFRKKFHLAAHMHLHTGVKAFNCDFCPKSFVNIREKKRHSRMHNKTHHCSECNMNFNLWSKYCKHVKYDHVMKEYKCNDCDRIFKRRNHMVRHVKVHAPKVFFCPYGDCDRFYSRNSNLKQHILSRHDQVTYDCTICKAKLSTKKSLREHIKKRHETEPVKRTYKTKLDGRKSRKDVGSLKTSTATLLTGLPQLDIETEIQPLLHCEIQVQDLDN